MENKLKKLFDYQKFEKNAHLQSVIQKTMDKYEVKALSDDDMFLVNAAGTGTLNKPNIIG